MNNKIITLASMLCPVLFAVIRPLNLSLQQSLITGCLLMVIIWWSTNAVKKIPACIVLLSSFIILKGAPLKVIFSFPLSENFILIVISYLFSQAVVKSGLVEHFIYPFLKKYATNPLKTIILISILFLLTAYAIPQPVARVILIASIFREYFKSTNMNELTQGALLYGVFLLFHITNNFMIASDLVVNTSVISFAQSNYTTMDWIIAMFLPSTFYLITVIFVFLILFKKELKTDPIVSSYTSSKEPLNRQEKTSAAIILATMVLWMFSPLLNLNVTLITVISTVILFIIGLLKKEDLKSIDITTLVFFTAAFSIGGVMKSCGAAEILFSQLKTLFPAEAGNLYLFYLITISMAVHMVLGSNTTTLSVVIPGFVMITAGLYSNELVMLLATVCVVTHAILPFHSVGLTVGAMNNFFPTKYITRYGLIATFVVYFAIYCIYVPWWRFIGLL